MKNRLLLVLLAGLSVLLGLAACSPPSATTVPSAVTAAPAALAPLTIPASSTAAPVAQSPLTAPSLAPSTVPAASAAPSAVPTVLGTPTPDTRLDPKYWSSWPVIPSFSAAAQQIYQHGIALGNDPHVFSTIGDCQSAPNVFLGIFESYRSPLRPTDTSLLQTVQFYAGSFSRQSLAVRDGLSAPSALTPLWSDRTMCGANENPVQCELRVRKPSIMFVNLGTNWKAGASAAPYEADLRQIVDLLIAHGTLPILSTKADNVEGDHSLNLATAKVAHDYDIPLWNFWRASNNLPNHGLDSRDNLHLAPVAWGPRSYTALQVLDAFWRVLNPAQAATVEAAASATAAASTSPTPAQGAVTATTESTVTTASTTAP